MIKVIDLHKSDPIIVKPTVFPDKTTQVWKLPYLPNQVRIEWFFESEAELIHLAQLLTLLGSNGTKVKEIFIPYLPYARQDKHVSNTSTFALHSFSKLLAFITGNIPVRSIDIHGYTYEQYINVKPTQFILQAYIQSKADLIVYPDKGAKSRYHADINLPSISFEKDRDQSTGKITNFKTEDEIKDTVKKVLMVDDLCDGGATFELLSKAIKTKHPHISVDLYVTHGVFSLGVHHLNMSIDKIYSTNSYMRDGSKANVIFDVNKL